nr:hypothetical protein B0A51_06517 [Rachicladosporium sp. CCFEE 5018]
MPDMKVGAAFQPRHSYRRPRTCDVADFWHVTPEYWAELLEAMGSDDDDERIKAGKKLATYERVAKLMETYDGITVPDFARCAICISTGTACRVARDGSRANCAKCLRHKGCQAGSVMLHGFEQMREMQLDAVTASVTKRSSSVEVVDGSKSSLPDKSAKGRRHPSNGLAPGDGILFVVPRHNQTLSRPLPAHHVRPKQRRLSAIGEHRARGNVNVLTAPRPRHAVSPALTMHPLHPPGDYGDVYWSMEEDKPASVKTSLHLPRRRVPSSPEIALATLPGGRYTKLQAICDPHQNNGTLIPPAEEGLSYSETEQASERSSSQRARDQADAEMEVLEAEASAAQREAKLLRTRYERKKLEERRG